MTYYSIDIHLNVFITVMKYLKYYTFCTTTATTTATTTNNNNRYKNCKHLHIPTWKYGVKQGAVLSPDLFSLFSNTQRHVHQLLSPVAHAHQVFTLQQLETTTMNITLLGMTFLLPFFLMLHHLSPIYVLW